MHIAVESGSVYSLLTKHIYVYSVLIAVFLAILTAPAARCAEPDRNGGGSVYPTGSSSSEIYLRERLVGLLMSGSGLGDIPPEHPLYPLRRIPLVVTATYLLLGYDPATLERLFPRLHKHLLDLFDEERVAAGGLITGNPFAGASGGIHLSPAVNALAGLEIHSLAKTAMRIGKYEDALELTAWSRQYTRQVVHTFYDPAHEAFFPVDRDGRFLMRYTPEGLLPLLLDRDTGEPLRGRIIDNVIEAGTVHGSAHGENAQGGEVWNRPILRAVIRGLMSNLPSVSEDMLDLFDRGSAAVATDEILPSHVHWMRFWTQKPVGMNDLFSPAGVIDGLRSFFAIMERGSVMKPGDLDRINADIAYLAKSLASPSSTVASFKAGVSAVNRLLAAVSNLGTHIESEDELWRVIDEAAWRALSPRTRKLAVRSLDLVTDELRYAKIVLSDGLARSTGIVAGVNVPEEPHPIGSSVSLEATIRSVIDSFDVENVYLQLGENRWSITPAGKRIPISPWTPPLMFRMPLPIPPGTEPGLVSIPYFFDFRHEDTRMELHGIANIGFVTGHRAGLHFPNGHALKNERLPVDIHLKYQPKHDIQGVVKGTFLEDLRCTPELPARFIVKEGAVVTTLPIVVTCRRKTPPGVYPFSLTIELKGEPIAVCEDRLVRPFRWLYLGPLPNTTTVRENAARYQDNLFGEHRTADGRAVWWSEVPTEAIDEEGSVMLNRLPGEASNSCILLYSIVDAPSVVRTFWHLKTQGHASIWVNGDLVDETEGARGAGTSGPVVLREGGNSILVAVGFKREPPRVSFNLSDQSGLPVPGLGNDIDSLIDGYYRLTGRDKKQQSPVEYEMQLAEVTIALDYPNASEICIIGAFNNWEAGANPMQRLGEGRWAVSMALPPGRYPYKFLVDRKSKIVDPGSRTMEPDGFGGFNSILIVK